MNNINFVGMYDVGDEEFILGKENTVEVPETGECWYMRGDLLVWSIM